DSGGRLGDLDRDLVTRVKDTIRFHRLAGDLNFAFFDQPLNLRSRLPGEHAGEISIDPDARLVGRNDQAVAIHVQAARLIARRGSGDLRRLSTTSMTRLSGARMIEMNCDVETPMMIPRSSPR